MERSQIDQHQMRIGPAGDDIEASLDEGCGEYFSVLDDRFSVAFEARLQRLMQSDRLGGNDMHQGPALQCRKNSRIDLSRDLLVTGEDQPASWPTQRLVRSGSDDMSVPQWARIDAAGYEPREMRHVHH